jgi:methionine synthase II (cobalamin-independent)
MKKNFYPKCLPLLIGSLPIKDHNEAANIIFEYTKEIPLWVQLPYYKKEGMIEQFIEGLPSLYETDETFFINTENENFEKDVLEFYEDYINSADKNSQKISDRFSLTEDRAKGFFVFLNKLKNISKPPFAIKGQITGPVTFGVSVKDQNQKSIFYNEELRDISVKNIAMKAKWQARKLSEFGYPVIIFLDEPALAGFGSSSFISISREEGDACLNEVIDAVHSENGLAGIHICANADWSIALDSLADIVSFDAYSFFDKFILYPDNIKKFLENGKILAWGIVPTASAEDIEKETADSLIKQTRNHIDIIEGFGIDRKKILNQSFITPSCGTGSLSFELAKKVIRLTKEVSDGIRKKEL